MDLHEAYTDNNKIIGNALLDNSELLGIITYEISSQKISSYKYKASDYPNINTFNNFTAYCNAKNCLYVSIHANAAGTGKEWKKAYGWSVWTTKGKTNSDKLG